MADPNVLIRFDGITDVLSVYVADSRATKVRPTPKDPRVLLEFDSLGRVIGVELLGVSDLVRVWLSHPARALVPTPLLTQLDDWVLQHADLRHVQ